jgi:hypothetical protein
METSVSLPPSDGRSIDVGAVLEDAILNCDDLLELQSHLEALASSLALLQGSTATFVL